MKYMILLLTLLIGACAGGDTTSFVEPPIERIDGTPWDDGYFLDEHERDEWCAREPDQPLCSELGTLAAEWTSAEYHGVRTAGSGAACHTASGGNCRFPKYKQIRVIIDHNSCSAQAQQLGVPLDVQQAVIQGYSEGLQLWHGKGGATVTLGGSHTSDKFTVYLRCEPSQYAGFAVFRPNTCSYKANLPTGAMSGVDPGAAWQCTQGDIVLDMQDMVPSPLLCPGNVAQGGRMRARYIAAHELGHMLGFGHFTEGDTIMESGILPTSCSPVPYFHSVFTQALSVYNGGGSGVHTPNVWLGLLL